jgi:hypothetical protein
MPFGNNYDYWTDSNLRLSDFQDLSKASEISGKVLRSNGVYSIDRKILLSSDENAQECDATEDK